MKKEAAVKEKGGKPFESVKPPEPQDIIILDKAPEIGVAAQQVPPEPEEDEQEQEPEQPNEQASPPEEDEDDLNPYFFLANQLKSDGYFDQEFTPDKKITGRALYDAVAENLKKQIEPKIKETVFAELQEQGVTQEDLQMARLIRSGVDVNVLQNKVAIYERLSTYNKDAEEPVKEAAVRWMYAEKGYGEKETNRIIEAAKTEGELEDLYKASTAFADQGYKHFVQEQTNQAELQRKAYKEQVERNNNLIRQKLEAQEIYGDKIDKQQAKEIDRAIYENSEIVEIDGQKYNVSEFKKFLFDFEQNPELRVWAFKKHKYRDVDLGQVKKEAKKEAEKDFLSVWKTNVAKKTTNSKKAVKDKLENSKIGESFFIDLNPKQ